MNKSLLKYALIILCALLMLPSPAAAIDNIAAETYILVNLNTGTVLHEHQADKIMYPASTTKVMTALLALEFVDPDEIITVGREVLTIPLDASKAGIMVGDQMTLAEMLYGLMLPSGNDIAYTIGIHIGRTVTGDAEMSIADALTVFTDLMTGHAHELGAENTNFANPDGYHHPDHYSTARDMAIITQAAMQHHLFREVIATGRYRTKTWTGPYVRPWGNTNRLIRSSSEYYYEFATGGKTGYTPEARFPLVSTAQKAEMELVSVIMGSTSTNRWSDSVSLLEYGFNNFTYMTLLTDNEGIATLPLSNFAPGEPETINVHISEGYSAVFTNTDSERIQQEISYNKDLFEEVDGQQTLRAPLVADQVIGELIIRLDDEVLYRAPLLVDRDIGAYPWWRRLVIPGTLAGVIGTGLIILRTIRIRVRPKYLTTQY